MKLQQRTTQRTRLRPRKLQFNGISFPAMKPENVNGCEIVTASNKKVFCCCRIYQCFLCNCTAFQSKGVTFWWLSLKLLFPFMEGMMYLQFYLIKTCCDRGGKEKANNKNINKFKKIRSWSTAETGRRDQWLYLLYFHNCFSVSHLKFTCTS